MTTVNCKCKADRDLLLEVSLVALAPVLVDALPPLLRAVPPRRRRRHHPLILHVPRALARRNGDVAAAMPDDAGDKQACWPAWGGSM